MHIAEGFFIELSADFLIDLINFLHIPGHLRLSGFENEQVLIVQILDHIKITPKVKIPEQPGINYLYPLGHFTKGMLGNSTSLATFK